MQQAGPDREHARQAASTSPCDLVQAERAASACGTPAAVGDRCQQQDRCGVDSRRSRSATRVLPTPPGPTTVTSRSASSSRCSAATRRPGRSAGSGGAGPVAPPGPVHGRCTTAPTVPPAISRSSAPSAGEGSSPVSSAEPAPVVAPGPQRLEAPARSLPERASAAGPRVRAAGRRATRRPRAERFLGDPGVDRARRRADRSPLGAAARAPTCRRAAVRRRRGRRTPAAPEPGPRAAARRPPPGSVGAVARAGEQRPGPRHVEPVVGEHQPVPAVAA